MQFGVAAEARGEAAGGVVETLLGQGDQFLRSGGQAARHGAQANAAVLQQPGAGTIQTALQIGDEGAQVGQHWRGQFGGARRGRGAPIRDEVDQGGVRLVPHGRDDRDGRRRHDARQALVVEAPQVLDRAAAPRHDQQVGAGDGAVPGHGVEAANGVPDLATGGVALDHDWPDDDPAGPALGDPVQDVANDGAGRAGDNADRARIEGDGRLAGRIEQALARQFDLQPFELGQEGAGAGRLHRFDHDLVRRPRRVGGDLAGDDDLEACLRLDAEAARRAFPDHAVDSRLVVLQRQIDVAGGVAIDLGHLASQPDVAEPVLQRALQGEGQLGNRQGWIVVAHASALGGGRLGVGGACEDVVVGHGVTVASPGGCGNRCILPISRDERP